MIPDKSLEFFCYEAVQQFTVIVYMNFRRVNDTVKLKELITTARFARCRSRFVMPVILYENKVGAFYQLVAVCAI